MSKQRYWKVTCSIGFGSPCNRTGELDICETAGITESELEQMSDKEIEAAAREMAEEWARDQLSYSVNPK